MQYKCQALHFEYGGPNQEVYFADAGVPTYCRMTASIVDTLGAAGILTKTGDFIHIKVANADMTYEIVDTFDDGDWVCRLEKAERKRDEAVVGAFGVF